MATPEIVNLDTRDSKHRRLILQFGSAAINRGVDAGVYTDLEGNP